MLQDIRDNSQGLIAKIIVGVIIAVFALFGVMRSTTLPGVAEVNGQEISEAQLQNNTQQLLNSIGAGIDSIDQDLLEQIALNQLIEQIILLQSAEEASMVISSNEIDRQMLETVSFQIGGVFNPDWRYVHLQDKDIVLRHIENSCANNLFCLRSRMHIPVQIL